MGVFIRGMIMLWTGSVAPSGWTLCNGVKVGGVTPPDLRDKFVMGSGGSQPKTGGYKDATLVSHNHTGTTNNSGAQKISAPLSGSTGDSGAETLTPDVTVTGTTDETGAHRHLLPHYLVQAVAGTGDIDRDNESQQWKAVSNQGTSEAGSHSHTVTSTGTITIGIPNHKHSLADGTAEIDIPDHTHAFTTDNAGEEITDSNLPPYYALAYIMKL